MQQLRTDLTLESYLDLLTKMRKNGYRLYAYFLEDKIIAVAGIVYQVNFYNKEHVFVYDLVTDNNYRSKGYGNKLLSHIHELAKQLGAKFVALKSGIHRAKAHKFYEEAMDYEKWCYSFRKLLVKDE